MHTVRFLPGSRSLSWGSAAFSSGGVEARNDTTGDADGLKPSYHSSPTWSNRNSPLCCAAMTRTNGLQRTCAAALESLESRLLFAFPTMPLRVGGPGFDLAKRVVATDDGGYIV